MAAETSANTRNTLRDLELRAAELFGTDGRGGRFKVMEDTLREHGYELEELKTFRTKAVLLGTIAMTLGGIIAGIAAKAVGWIFGG
jgi:hypothetical protein